MGRKFIHLALTKDEIQRIIDSLEFSNDALEVPISTELESEIKQQVTEQTQFKG